MCFSLFFLSVLVALECAFAKESPGEFCRHSNAMRVSENIRLPRYATIFVAPVSDAIFSAWPRRRNFFLPTRVLSDKVELIYIRARARASLASSHMTRGLSGRASQIFIHKKASKRRLYALSSIMKCLYLMRYNMFMIFLYYIFIIFLLYLEYRATMYFSSRELSIWNNIVY